MIDTYTRYRMLSADLPKALDRTAQRTDVARETEYYLEHIRDVKSIDDFLGDYRLYSYAMKALGLEDMIYAKAFMRKVLTEGIDTKDTFANRLADDRYRTFAETFNFARYGAATTSFSRTQEGVTEKFVRQSLEVSEGEDNQGVRLALYFQRQAGTIETAYDILADQALKEVVFTALGLPQEMGLADIDVQAKTLEEKLDIGSLSDPAGLETFVGRFTALWDLENGPTVVEAPNVMLTDPLSAGVGQDLLMSINSLKLGGA